MRGLPVFFTALAEEDLDQIFKRILRILHAAQDWTRFFGKR
jgi:plasmid stabilization system protein ParE